MLYTDFFHFNGQDYLIVVDAYSFYWEAIPVGSTSAKSAVKALFTLFQHFGYPAEIKSDNGPAFASHEFITALQRCGIRHVTSSPYYPRGNALAERAVAEAKRLMKKCPFGTMEYYQAMLDIRNTPRNEAIGSPMQRLMARQARTLLPTTKASLHPRVIPPAVVTKGIREEREKQKTNYDEGTRQRAPLRQGQGVTIQDPNSLEWKKGTVVAILPQPRSYLVREEGAHRTTRRNHSHIRATPQPPETESSEEFHSAPSSPTTPGPAPPMPPSWTRNPSRNFSRDAQLRRSERIRKPVSRYREF